MEALLLIPYDIHKLLSVQRRTYSNSSESQTK